MAMLERLSIRDFALIESLDLEVSAGFTVFTGETGAGKSLVVGAIGFLFGERTDASIVREGAAESVITASFDISKNDIAKTWLGEKNIQFEEDCVLVRRGMKANGRSYSYIQNASVTRNDLVEFTGFLGDIHGQHEHQKLLDEEKHIDILDTYADLGAHLEEYRSFYEAWIERAKEYKRRKDEADTRKREEDLLRFTVQEIKSLRIKSGEDEELIREEKILTQHERLFDSIASTVENLSATSNGGKEGVSALAALKKAKNELAAASTIDSSLLEYAQRLEAAFFEIEDIAGGVSSYRETLRFDPDRLQYIEARMAELRRVKKKYGPSLDDVITRGIRDSKSLEDSSSWEEDKIIIEKDIQRLRSIAFEKAEQVSRFRNAAALAFSKRVESILSKLGMPTASLPVYVEKKESNTGATILGSKGMDALRILIAPNVGEAPRPLVRIASGGELSRVALAIKTVLSSKDTTETLIFDEIDTGIGGEVAVSVGTYLRDISDHRQVFCVTHLATIAACADSHFKVEKHFKGERTITTVNLLNDKEREGEIARMLSGDSGEDASRLHAAALLRKASLRKIVQ
jgi:DNA repair protein RecN (Recombination protein N)